MKKITLLLLYMFSLTYISAQNIIIGSDTTTVVCGGVIETPGFAEGESNLDPFMASFDLLNCTLDRLRYGGYQGITNNSCFGVGKLKGKVYNSCRPNMGLCWESEETDLFTDIPEIDNELAIGFTILPNNNQFVSYESLQISYSQINFMRLSDESNNKPLKLGIFAQGLLGDHIIEVDLETIEGSYTLDIDISEFTSPSLGTITKIGLVPFGNSRTDADRNIFEVSLIKISGSCSDARFFVSPSTSIELKPCETKFIDFANEDNSNEVFRKYYISEDNEAPLIEKLPDIIVDYCDPIPRPIPPNITDNCGYTVRFQEAFIASRCPYSQTVLTGGVEYTWTATDSCGNLSSMSYTVSRDIIGEIRFSIESHVLHLECQDALPDQLDITATGLCEEKIPVEYLRYSEYDSIDSCGYKVIEWYIAMDPCLGRDTVTRTIIVAPDTEDPIFLDDFPDQEIDFCEDFPQRLVPRFEDNCGASIEFVEIILDSQCADGSGFDAGREYQYTITDACGNFAGMTYSVIRKFETGIRFTGVPENTEIQCGDPFPEIAIVKAFGPCGEELDVFVESDGDETMCEDGMTRIIYTASDSCFGEQTASYIVTRITGSMPSIKCPPDTIISCTSLINGSIPKSVLGFAMVTDECGQEIPLTDIFAVNSNPKPGNCGIDIRTWTYVGDCKTVDCEQEIQVIDTIAPIILVNPDLILECYETDLIGDGVEIIGDSCDQELIPLKDDISISGDLCEGSTLTTKYSVTDSCGNTRSISRVVVTKGDTIPPKIFCPADTSIYQDDNCIASYIPDYIRTSDHCSGVDVKILSTNGQEYILGEILRFGNSYGTVLLTYEATDACKNVSICEQKIEIIPEPDDKGFVCDDRVVSFTTGNCTRVDASIFVVEDGIKCCDDISYVFSTDEVNFYPTIDFCCSTETLQVWVRAYNNCDSTYRQCESYMKIQDKIAPVCLDPEDIALSCTNIDWLEDYWKVPEVLDTCEVDTLYTIDDATNNCNIGDITKIWTFTDQAGNFTTCQQTITLEETSLSDSDIRWPQDTMLLDVCDSDLSDFDLGVPILPDSLCSMMTPSYKDQVFYKIGSQICTKILRKWTLIDWCGYEANSDNQLITWTYVQTIKLVDTEAPEIFVTQDTVILNVSNECDTARFDFSLLEYYALDCDQKLSEDALDHTAKEYYTLGEHEIIITASDKCGNRKQDTVIVLVEDNKAPSILCLTGLTTVIQDMGKRGTMSEIWAKDFILESSLDSCDNLENLIASFSPDSLVMNKNFTCETREGGVVFFNAYLSDASGNTSTCEVQLFVQDNNDLCTEGGSSLVQVGGSIFDKTSGEVMSDVEVIVNNTIFQNTVDGKYVFDLTSGENYRIEASYNKEVLKDVSTLDMVLIQKHILGLDLFSTPEQYIAGDVNGDKKISVIDLLEVRNVLLGNAKSFTQPSYVVIPSTNTLSMDDPMEYEFSYKMLHLERDIANVDFVAYKIGNLSDTKTRSFSKDMKIEVSRSKHSIDIEFPQEIILADLNYINEFDERRLLESYTLETQITLLGDNIRSLQGRVWDQEGNEWNITHDLQFESQEDIILSPNPVHDILNISGNQNTSEQWGIYDTDRKLVLTKSDNETQIDVSSLKSGIYFLRTHQGMTKKFVKH